MRYSLILLLILFAGCSQTENDIPEEEMTITFTGDVLLDRGVRPVIDSIGLKEILKEVKEVFKKSDYVVINLECPLTNHKTPLNKKYIFRADSTLAKELVFSGVTHCDLANNHTNDQGRSGLIETASILKKHGIKAIGYGTNHNEACNPVIIEKNGIKAAIFASVHVTLENWMFLPEKPSQSQASPDELCKSIEEFKKNNKECKVIVLLHWGKENQTSADYNQQNEAVNLINAGADIIIGHHQHVILPVDNINGKYVFYGLGNFVFDQKKPNQNLGLMLKLRVRKSSNILFEAYPVKIENCMPKFLNFNEINWFNEIVPNFKFNSFYVDKKFLIREDKLVFLN